MKAKKQQEGCHSLSHLFHFNVWLFGGFSIPSFAGMMVLTKSWQRYSLLCVKERDTYIQAPQYCLYHCDGGGGIVVEAINGMGDFRLLQMQGRLCQRRWQKNAICTTRKWESGREDFKALCQKYHRHLFSFWFFMFFMLFMLFMLSLFNVLYI